MSSFLIRNELYKFVYHSIKAFLMTQFISLEKSQEALKFIAKLF